MRKKQEPDCVTTVRDRNTLLVVSAFFSEESSETAADKMSRVLDLETGLKENQKSVTLKC